MTTDAVATLRTRAPWAFPVVVVLLAATYLLQTVSPLRLDTDSLNYLIMATALADGVPVPAIGLPIGYSHVVALLDRAGLASAFSFVLLNCLFIAIGLAAVWRIIDRDNDASRRWVVVFTLLAFPVVKSIAMPMPEATFFGITLVTLALMTKATTSPVPNRIVLLLVCIPFVFVAMSIRVVGAALIPALLWATFADYYRRLVTSNSAGHAVIWIAGICVALLALAAVVIGPDRFAYYGREAVLIYPRGVTGSAFRAHGTSHLATVGELVVNLPSTKFRGLSTVFVTLGIASVVGTFAFARLTRKLAPADVYIGSFVFLLIAWPHSASRLWMPIIPLLIGYVVRLILRWKPERWSLNLVRVYIAGFVLAGLAAIAFTTRTSLAGNNFSQVYGNAGGLSNLPKPGETRNELYNGQARELMRRYGTGAELSAR